MRVVLAATLATAGCAGAVRPPPPANACIHEAAYGRRHRAQWFLRDHPMTHEELEAELVRDPVAALDLQEAWHDWRRSSTAFRTGMGIQLLGGITGVLIAQNDDSDNHVVTFVSIGVILGAVITSAVVAISSNEAAEDKILDAVDHYNASCPR
jgi:hypothetical protein